MASRLGWRSQHEWPVDLEGGGEHEMTSRLEGGANYGWPVDFKKGGGENRWPVDERGKGAGRANIDGQ
jgi:hypothetical protein